MGEKTGIQWTDCTDNIIVAAGGGWWCRRRSAGCDHCYAETVNQNPFFGGNRQDYRGEPPPLVLRRDILAKWARQSKPRRHFVASMTDVLGEWVPRAWIFEYLDAMAAAPRQTFQLLTKREDVAEREINAWLLARGLTELPANIWIGFTVENQEYADRRIPFLLRIPARARFLSVEPMLGPVDLSDWLIGDILPQLHWVIVGGESGDDDDGNAKRPIQPLRVEWVRDLRDQCEAACVPFFFKQWGEHFPREQWEHNPLLVLPGDEDAQEYERVGKRAAGRSLDGRPWDEFPKGA